MGQQSIQYEPQHAGTGGSELKVTFIILKYLNLFENIGVQLEFARFVSEPFVWRTICNPQTADLGGRRLGDAQWIANGHLAKKFFRKKEVQK